MSWGQAFYWERGATPHQTCVHARARASVWRLAPLPSPSPSPLPCPPPQNKHLSAAHRCQQGLWQQELRYGVDDVSLREPLRRGGWQYRFVVAALNVDTSEPPARMVPNMIHFLGRQNLFTRIHHKEWVLVHSIGSMFPLLPLVAAMAAMVLTAVGGAPGAKASATLLAGAAAHAVGNSLLLVAVHALVRRAAARHSVKVGCGLLRIFMASLMHMPMIYIVNLYATLWGIMARHFVWRGVHYEVSISPSPMMRITRDEQDEARAAAGKGSGNGKPAAVVHAVCDASA